ncbi:MAG: hypothetical protein QOK03_1498, partial [Candidatus Binataceae bacterium]|nr:hypothetical protein [Candidatus Binataceae bacterium]
YMGRYLTSLLIAVVLSAGLTPIWADKQTREVQEELRKRHLFYNDIDGKYTAALAAAIKRYQTKKGFPPSGVLDRETLGSLGIVEAAPPGEGPAPVVAKNKRELRDPNGELLPGSQSSLANAPRRLDRKQLQEFVSRYLAACQSPQLQDELSFYGSEVDYFDHGTVDRGYIQNELAAYDQHWPQRRYIVGDSVRVVNQDDKLIAQCRIGFELTNERLAFSTTGRTDNTYVLKSREDGNWEITGVKEEELKQAAPRQRPARPEARTGRTGNPITMAFHTVDRAMHNFFGARPGKGKRSTTKRL